MASSPPPPLSCTRQSGAVALAVLGDPNMLLAITGFQAGVPQTFVDLRRRNHPNGQSPSHEPWGFPVGYLVLALRELPPFGDGDGKDQGGEVGERVEEQEKLVHRTCRFLLGRATTDEEHAALEKFVLSAVANSGHLTMVKWLHTELRAPTWAPELLLEVLEKGHTHVARWLWATIVAPKPQWDQGIIQRSLVLLARDGRNGDLARELLDAQSETVTYGLFRVIAKAESASEAREHELTRSLLATHPRICGMHWGVVDDAAERGDLALIRVLYAHSRLRGSTKAMDAAARRGDLAMLQFLHEQGRVGCTKCAMDDAAGNGYLEVVQFLHEHRDEGCTTAAMNRAARNGHLQVVQFLHERRIEGCTELAVHQAARNGHLSVIVFLLRHREEGYTTRTTMDAARLGHLEIVRLLHEEYGEVVDEYVLATAAEAGQFVVVRYILAQEKRPRWHFVRLATEWAKTSELAEYIRTTRPRSDCVVEEGPGWYPPEDPYDMATDHRRASCRRQVVKKQGPERSQYSSRTARLENAAGKALAYSSHSFRILSTQECSSSRWE